MTLQINYRSTPQVVEAAGRLIAHNKNRFAKEISAAKDSGRAVRIEGFESTAAMERALIGHLLREKREGKLKECAVISRTSGIFPVFAEKCRQAGIPCFLKEKVKSIFDSEIVDDLLAYLDFSRTPVNNRSRSRFFQFMNRPLRYISREAVNETADFAHMLRFYQGRPSMQETVGQLQADLERIRTMPVFLAVNYIRKVVGYDRYLSEKYGQKDFAATLEEADLIQDSAKNCRTLSQWKEKIEERKREDTGGKRKAPDSGQEAEIPEDSVTFVTMHGSKGLEYDKVFIPNCNEGTTPHKKARSEAEIEEERRMFYVGMTRAKKELTLLFVDNAKSAEKEGESAKTMLPSRFLKELQESYSNSSNSH